VTKTRWLDRATLTSPHFLAYSYVLEMLTAIGVGSKSTVLDFGSRYSKLPSIIAGRIGCRVMCLDRDPEVTNHQNRLSEEYGVSGLVSVVAGLGKDNNGGFDAITACWAVQHNALGDIPVIVAGLAESLRPGGLLVLVGSWTAGEAYLQADRPDPQWVLGPAGYRDLVARSGCVLLNQCWFRYQHRSLEGDWCSFSDANATALTLQKPVVPG